MMSTRVWEPPLRYIRRAVQEANQLRSVDGTISRHPAMSQRRTAEFPGIEAIWIGSKEIAAGVPVLERRCSEWMERASREHRRVLPSSWGTALNVRSVRRGIRMRTVAPGYAPAFLASPGHAVGGLAVALEVPLSTVVVDGRVALMTGCRTDGEPLYVVVTEHGIVQAASRYLARLQETSMPVQPNWRRPGIDPTHRQLRIMALLARGHKDEAIARQLGVSSRTVRSEVAALAASLGVASRFELGIAWARWLDGR